MVPLGTPDCIQTHEPQLVHQAVQAEGRLKAIPETVAVEHGSGTVDLAAKSVTVDPDTESLIVNTDLEQMAVDANPEPLTVDVVLERPTVDADLGRQTVVPTSQTINPPPIFAQPSAVIAAVPPPTAHLDAVALPVPLDHRRVLGLERRVQDLEAILALRNEELEKLLNSQGFAVQPPPPPPPPPAPPFVRPLPTVAQLRVSSMWAMSGHPDPSVDMHPASSWYGWFRANAPSTPNANNDETLILEPVEPALSPHERRPISFTLPQYVLRLLTPEARYKDDALAQEARALFDSGRKIRPPPPAPGSFGPLGQWDGVQIETILQAHNLRHRAITDGDDCAVNAYRQLHTKYTDRSLPRSEGVDYLMKAFFPDARYL